MNSRGRWWTAAAWLLALPGWCFVGVLRHEASHAVAVWIQGGQVIDWSLSPSIGSWGYVISTPVRSGLLVLAAPYLCDQVTFLVGWGWWARELSIGRRVHIVGLTIGSALVNTGANCVGALVGRGDISRLLEALPVAASHAYLCAMLAVFLWATTTCVGELLAQARGSAKSTAII